MFENIYNTSSKCIKGNNWHLLIEMRSH